MISLKLSLANKAVSVVAVMMVVMASLSVVNAATCTTSSLPGYCGTSAHLDTSVGPSTSEPVTAYYFYNDSYAPSVFVTSDNINCPVQFSLYNNNQSLNINGIVESISNSTSGFIFAFRFRAESTYNPLLDLQPNQYVANGGTVDPTQYSFWSLIEGTLAGYGSYQGVSLSVAEFMHPLQIGRGASGKNLNFGAGGWFTYINERGQQIQTDLNVDLTGYSSGSSNSNCNAATTCSSHGACSADGSCYCYTGYSGSSCSQCASGYSGYPNCSAICDAATTCSSHGSCAADGSCVCNTGFTGSSCNQCASGYYNYPSCVACDATTTCSSHGSCSSDGSCSCNVGFTGSSCNQCSSGYYSYPSCVACDATTNCSSHGICATDGSCSCNVGFTGSSCNQCSSGYTGYPSCTSLTGGLVNTPTATPTNSANVVSHSVGYIAAATVAAVVIFV